MQGVQQLENTQSEKSEDIIVYTNRGALMPMLIIGIVGCIFFLVYAILASASFIIYPDQRNGGTIAAVIVFLGFIALSLWLMRSMIGLTTPGIPMLVINHEGIRAGTKTYGSTEFAFPWTEIQAIYVLGPMFCIRPVNKEKLLSDFPLIKRLLLSVTFPKDIYVSQFYLEKPVAMIFERLEEKFASELENYHIQLHP